MRGALYLLNAVRNSTVQFLKKPSPRSFAPTHVVAGFTPAFYAGLWLLCSMTEMPNVPHDRKSILEVPLLRLTDLSGPESRKIPFQPNV